ncbi:MAG: DUF1080 domain-containing protein [Cyclobacteriaceae bacterium]|nr:DUF1080 domain-containing protein [Cyclobacteriaceae bacterium]
MKTITALAAAITLSLLLNNPIHAASDADPFLGRWALHLPGGAGWLEVKQESDHLDASILWYGGSVVPVSSVYVHQGKLYINRVRSAEFGDRTLQIVAQLEIEVNGDQLIGKLINPKKDGSGAGTTLFHGNKIADLPAKPNLANISYAKPVKLFNGKDLTGWEVMGTNQNGWKVEKGILINDPANHDIRYANIKTTEKYEDFNLTLQVNIPEGSNSGVYLRGIYEVQVVDSYGKEVDSHNMGALYSRVTPASANEKKAGEWQEMDITLYKRHLTVKLNGKTIIDNHPVYGVTGGAMTADEFSPGPIYLQGDHGKVLYKDMVLKPIID